MSVPPPPREASGLAEGILITGGGRGIGRALATHLSAAGELVISASIEHREPPAHAAEYLPGHVVERRVDVRREAEVRELFRTLDGIVRVRALVNCAGIGRFQQLEEMKLDDWEEVLSTNLTGAFLTSREAIARMRRSGGGRIVNIGSVAGATPIAGNGAYGCSKAAVQMLTDIINAENHAHNVFATCVVMGAVYTDIWLGRPEFDPADMLAVETVSELIAGVLRLPDGVRMDAVKVLPKKGIL